MEPSDCPTVRTIVVGGGAAGTITAAHLLRQADAAHPVDVTIVDPSATIGPGLPYRTTEPRHTLNNVVARMSAFDDEPGHLLRWCAARGIPAEPRTFLQRSVYGDYLAGLLAGVPRPPGSTVRHVRARATDLVDDGSVLAVRLSDGRTLCADHVVLALGTPAPRRLAPYEGMGRTVTDPWDSDLAERAAGTRSVLLVGTGLTAADAATVVHRANPDARITAVSRHGLLPAVHAHDPLVPPSDVDLSDIHSLDDAVAAIADHLALARAAGADWRPVLDAVRHQANDVWSRLPMPDRARFVHEHARSWESARHRMPREMRSYLSGLVASGALTFTRADDIDPGADFDLVVRCTGPGATAARGWNPLVDALLDRPSIRPHPLGLGLDLDPGGSVRGLGPAAQGRVHAVGAARRGLAWEVAAIPDIRTQAARLADSILARAAVNPERGRLRDHARPPSQLPPRRQTVRAVPG